MANQIHPAMRAIIDPTIDQMTQITLRNKMFPECGKHNESDAEKQIKRTCVHWIRDTSVINGRMINGGYIVDDLEKGDIYPCVEKINDHEYICKACGRKINVAFDQDSVNAILKTIEVLDGLVMLAPQMHLKPEVMQALISIKSNLPLVAEVQANFNEFIRKDDSNTSAANSLTSDYQTPERYNNITGMAGTY